MWSELGWFVGKQLWWVLCFDGVSDGHEDGGRQHISERSVELSEILGRGFVNGNGNAMEHGCGSWFEDDDDDCDELPRAEGRASAWQQHRVRLRTVVIAHCTHYKKWFSVGIHKEQQHWIRKSRQRGEGGEGNGRRPGSQPFGTLFIVLCITT